ncbi:MAG TPA: PadR family transcriptional regulator [Gaiellaceae bacterium]|jgi:DNA-binding PadR family transcriptional regulator
MRERTTTEMAVLGLLAEGERSGYDLAQLAHRTIEAMWAPSRSQIYKVLPRLVADGLATRREVEQQGRPDKAIYHVTAAGRDELVDWLARVDDPAGQDGEVFLLKIFFGRYAPPAAALAQLAAYRTLLERRLAGYEELERGLAADEPVHSRIAILHAVARLRATLTWTEETRLALEQLPAAARRRRG